MRLGVRLRFDPEVGARDLLDEARRAEELGFDLVWIEGNAGREPGDLPTALPVAAALAVATEAVRVGVTAEAGDAHPLYLAEEVAVADQMLGGRLVLAVRPAPGFDDRMNEALELITVAQRGRPFRHPGPVWPTPANLPDNRANIEQRVRVTPPPAQLEVPLWLAGCSAAPSAAGWGLPVMAQADEGAEVARTVWEKLEADMGKAAGRLPRPAIRPVDTGGDGSVSSEDLVSALVAERDDWGLDVAVLDFPRSLDATARRRCLETIAHEVRPRIQLERVPPTL